jgi:hypothetical protein
MKTLKQLGIWMDHSQAHLIEFASENQETKILTSDSHDPTENSTGNENAIHNKEQQQQGTFYKGLSKIIKDFDEVILFGPTSAKAELHNILKDDHQFADIKIEVKTTDKMSDKDMQDFVGSHFNRFDFKN